MHHHEHFWWRFFPKKELDRIYLCMALRSFAISLMGLFVPLYLYVERGYSLVQILYFFIFYSLVFAISTPIAAKFSTRYGLKHAVLLSVPFHLLYIFLLFLLPSFKIPLLIIGFSAGVAVSFFWMGMHPIFYYASNHKHRGEEFGKRTSISILATLFGPLFGGLLIKFAGFKILFIIASILLFLASFFLFLSKEEHIKYHFSIRSLLNKDHWKDSLFFVSRGMRVVAGGIIWPLFIFFILNDYLTLGVLGSLLAGLSAVFIWLMGKFSDYFDKRKIIRWMIGFEALSWFLRAIVSTVGHVFGATIFGGVTYGLVESPLGSLMYNKAEGKDIASYFVSREVFLCLGRVLLLVFVLVTDSLSGGLIFNGVASLAALLF